MDELDEKVAVFLLAVDELVLVDAFLRLDWTQLLEVIAGLAAPHEWLVRCEEADTRPTEMSCDWSHGWTGDFTGDQNMEVLVALDER